MPNVSFYVLGSESLHDRYFFACRLISKAYQSGEFCYVLLDSIEQCQELDDKLWTFRAKSFIPHQIFTGLPPEITSQVLLGTVNAPVDWQNVIFNLSAQMPQEWQQAKRVLEILDNSEATKTSGRQRYRSYQQAGVNVETHKM